MTWQNRVKHRRAQLRIVRIVFCLCLVPVLWFAIASLIPRNTHLSSDIYDSDCVRNNPTRSTATRAIGAGKMHNKAMTAANSLLNVEYDSFDLLADCINPKHGEPVRARISTDFKVLNSSGWTRSKLLDAARTAATIYAPCGIHYNDINVTVVDAKDDYKDVDWGELFQLSAATRVGRYPTLFFINEQDSEIKRQGSILGMAMHGKFATWPERYPQHFESVTGQPARYAGDFGVKNTAIIVGHHLDSQDPLYVNFTKSMGIAISHELFHIYGNCECHMKAPGNFMNYYAAITATGVTSGQCSAALAAIQRFDEEEREWLHVQGSFIGDR